MMNDNENKKRMHNNKKGLNIHYGGFFKDN